jgi:hypothetical protein
MYNKASITYAATMPGTFKVKVYLDDAAGGGTRKISVSSPLTLSASPHYKETAIDIAEGNAVWYDLIVSAAGAVGANAWTDGTSENDNVYLYLYDQTGKEVTNGYGSYNKASITYAATKPGTFKVKIYLDDAAGGGTRKISVSSPFQLSGVISIPAPTTPTPTTSASTIQAPTQTKIGEPQTPTTPALTTPVPNVPEQTAKSASLQNASPESSNSYLYAGIGGAVLIFIAIIILKNRGAPKEEKTLRTAAMIKSETKIEKKSESNAQIKSIAVTSAFGYKGASIQFKVKVENPTIEPVADIKITLFVPDVFLISEPSQKIAMLKSGESKTATFEIRPTGECGTCEVSGKVAYYDYSTKKTNEVDIPAKNLSIICPMLKSKEITEDILRSFTSKFVKAEESTKEIEMPAFTLFDIISDIMRDMNLFMLEPKRTESSGVYRATGRFYGEGIKGLRYAAQAEVIGGQKKSKLILKAWAEQDVALVGFYHGIWDEIEKRIHVKQYIDTPIVQHFYHIDNSIGTKIEGDVVAVRSNIGAFPRKCPHCAREVDVNEKFCRDCGEKLGEE